MDIKPKSGNKILVIGLDGLGRKFFGLLKNKYPGYISNLLRLEQEGALMTLKSVVPTVTPVAWTSFMTGVYPATHGIYDFVSGGKYANASSIKSKTLWKALSERNKKVGALHVPMTYPSEKINGFMIPGQFAPNFSKDSIYPPELHERHAALFDGYSAFCDSKKYDHNGYGPNDVDGFIKGLTEVLVKKIKLNMTLLDEYPDLDVFATVFFGTDTVQHYLWKYFDNEHPNYNKAEADKYIEKLLEYFRILDEGINDIICKFGEDSTVFIVSDHGMDQFHSWFHTNEWLREQGLISFNERNSLAGKACSFIADCIQRLLPGTKEIDVRSMKQPLLWRVIRKLRNVRIDPLASKAFGYCENGIRIRVKGRDPGGIVARGEEYETLRNDILNKLKAYKDPRTGNKVISEVLLPDNIMTGKYIDEAPDIVFVPTKGYWSDNLFPFKEIVDNARYKTAQHSLDGLLIANGRGIQSGANLEDASLTDISVTILSMLGVPYFEPCDGKPLKDIFTKEFQVAIEELREAKESFSIEPAGGPKYNKDDEEIIKKRLEGLGYLT